MRKITIVLIFTLAAVCGCQQTTETVKVIYELPVSDSLAKLENRERACWDSLNKYGALGDTALTESYLARYKEISDSCSTLLKQEVESFMGKKK